jgi:hypothetical protein
MWPGWMASLVISVPLSTVSGRAATPVASGFTTAASLASWYERLRST